jgi:hypothetical protein
MAGSVGGTRRGRGLAKASMELIDAMVRIAEAIHPCSVRAIAYQLFNAKLIPSMSKGDTQRVSRYCVIARERGLLPWEWIVDEGREEEHVSTWDDPADYARAVQRSYRRNKWEAQPAHVAVWSEKGTIQGTLRPVLEEYEVPFQVLHGWSGATPVWDAAEANLGRSQSTVILYVGDYDPSGMGMSQLDLPSRLARYSTKTPSDKDLSPLEVAEILNDVRLDVRRIALTKLDTFTLGSGPSFPAADKRKDSRYEWFVRNFGQWCWELDALPPPTLRARVEDAIRAEIDRELWDRYVTAEVAERASIEATCQTWTSILRQDQE